MDPEKLKFSNSRIKVLNFAKTSSSEFQNLSFDDKSRILKKYYVDTLSRYPDGIGKIILWLFSG